MRAALVWLLVFGAVAAHADKLISLSVDGRNLGVVVLVETASGVLIERSALVGIRDIDARKLAALPGVSAQACLDCVRLSDIGELEEDRLRAQVSLSLSPQLRRPTELFGSGETARREALHSGAGFILNYSLLARAADGSAGQQALIVEPRLSLGPLGVLDAGWVVDHEAGAKSEWRRLDAKLTRYFVDSATSLQLGEVRSLQAFNQNGQAIIGARLARDFSIRPDIASSPALSFYTELERPSTVSLFVNGQQRRQQEIRQPGEVRLTDYRPAASGRVAVVVSDITGSEQVLELDLYQDRDLLNPGQVDFSVTAGQFNSEREGLASAPVVDGYFRVGLSHWLALGAATSWADYQGDPGSLFSGEYWMARLGLTGRLRGVGKFELSYGQHQDGMGSSDSTRLYWSNSFRVPGKLAMTVGGFFFDDEGLRSATQEDLSFKGYRAFGGVSSRRWTLSVNGYDINEIKGIGSTLEYRWGRARLSASVSDAQFSDPVYLLRFAYRFNGGSSGGLKSRYQEETRQFEHGAFVRASMWDSRLNVTADHAEAALRGDDVAPGVSRSSLRGSLDAGVADISMQYQNRGGEESVSGLVSGAVLLDSELNMQLSPRVSERHGVLTVSSSEPNLAFKVGGTSYHTGRDGAVVVPLSGFSKQVVSAQTNTLPLGVYVKNDLQALAVYPGQGARVHFEVLGLAVRVVLPGIEAGSMVSVDGKVLTYDGQYLPLSNQMPGALHIETAAGRYVATLSAGQVSTQLTIARREE